MAEAQRRYETSTNLAQQANNLMQAYEATDTNQQLVNKVLYDSYIPVHEIAHFGDKLLNVYSPQKMKAVRGYFEQGLRDLSRSGFQWHSRGQLRRVLTKKYAAETGQHRS